MPFVRVPFSAYLYDGDQLARMVSSRPTARAYRVTRIDGKIQEKVWQPEYLGK